MMSAEVHALTGAYVLDALTGDERAAFEAHLSECEACAVEVAELRATTTRLATAAAADAPPRLRENVLARISEVRQVGPGGAVPVLAHHRPARRLLTRLTAAAAALLLVATTVLGVLLVRERQATDDAERRATAMSSLLRAPDAEFAAQNGETGRLTVVFSRAQDRMMVFAADLPPAPSGYDYQAWAIGDDVISAGLLVPANGTALLEASLGTAEALGVTIEPAGGSPRPTTPPIMRVNLQ